MLSKLIFLITLTSALGATLEDQRVREMWNWYQPNSEKLTILLANWQKVITIFKVHFRENYRLAASYKS